MKKIYLLGLALSTLFIAEKADATLKAILEANDVPSTGFTLQDINTILEENTKSKGEGFRVAKEIQGEVGGTTNPRVRSLALSEVLVKKKPASSAVMQAINVVMVEAGISTDKMTAETMKTILEQETDLKAYATRQNSKPVEDDPKKPVEDDPKKPVEDDLGRGDLPDDDDFPIEGPR